MQRLTAALWFGSAVFLMLSASAAFRAAGNTSVAADVVGALLTRWHYIALAAPLVLFAFELRSARPMIVIVLFVAIVLAATQSFVDLRIRSIRQSSPVAISSLEPTDPLRRRFGALHGVSMMLLVAQTIIAGTMVLAVRQKAPKTEPAIAAAPPAPPEPEPAAEPVEIVADSDTSGGGP
jgi:hypothetical protein